MAGKIFNGTTPVLYIWLSIFAEPPLEIYSSSNSLAYISKEDIWKNVCAWKNKKRGMYDKKLE